MTSVTLSGRTFDDTGSPWILEKDGLTGWFDTATVRGDDIEHPGRHGSFALPATRGSRVVGVNVAIQTESAAAAEQARDTLAALLADGHFEELSVTSNSGRTTTARVRLNASTLVEWTPWTNTVRGQIELWAPDPLRYGDPESVDTGFPVRLGGLRFPLYSNGAGVNIGALDYGRTSTTGRMVLSNSGTADTWPQFQVEGPVSAEGFDIAVVGTDRRIRFSGPVAAGSVLLIDTASGTAVIDEYADRGGQLTYRDWFAVPAGGSVEIAFIPLGPTSEATLTGIVRPGWW